MKTYLLTSAAVAMITLTMGLLAYTGLSQDLQKESHENKEPAVTVGMTNTMKFIQDTVRIKKGETVLWENSSLLAHSVTGDPSQSTVEGSAQVPAGAKTFNSGMMDPEETFKHTFKVAGTYQYFCIPHEGVEMFGWVIVE